jgi:RHS repeat-associated protein
LKPFRNCSSTGTQANEFKFTGEQADASTGLEYLRARYYDPAVGRFISRDSYGGSAGQPQSQNRFVYVEGNPVGHVDPTGLAKATDCGFTNPFHPGSIPWESFQV